MLSHSYEIEDWKWKWRVAFLFIIAHMIIFILPFFSVVFLLMDILGEGQSHGKLGTGLFHTGQALAECLILIILVGVFFCQLLTMFVKPFSSLVASEVGLLVAYHFFTSFNSSDLDTYDGLGSLINKSFSAHSHTFIPVFIITVCTVIKIGCAYWSQLMESAKKTLLKRGPGKIV